MTVDDPSGPILDELVARASADLDRAIGDGDLVRAEAALARLDGLLGSAGASLPGQHRVLWADLLITLGRDDDARAQLRASVRDLRAELTGPEAPAHAEPELLGSLCWAAGALADSLANDAPQAALDVLSELLDDPRLRFEADQLAELGLRAGDVARLMGRPSDAERRYRSVAALGDRAGTSEADAAVELAALARERGDLIQAETHLRRARAVLVGADDGLRAVDVELMLGEVLVDRGLDAEARHLLAGASRRCATLRDAVRGARCEVALGILDVAAGDHQRAVERWSVLPPDVVDRRLLDAVIRLGIGDHARALAILDQVRAGPGGASPMALSAIDHLRSMAVLGAEGPQAAGTHTDGSNADPEHLLVRAVDLLAGGRPAAAEELAERAAVAFAATSRADAGRARIVVARARLVGGDLARARLAMESAGADLAGSPRIELRAALHLVSAQIHVAAGDLGAAIVDAVRAVSILDEIRHSLAWTGHRHIYSARASEAYELAIGVALEMGDEDLVAELVVRAHVQILPLVGPQDGVAALAIGRDAPGGSVDADELVPLAAPAAVRVRAADPPRVPSSGDRPDLDLPRIARSIVGGDGPWRWLCSWTGSEFGAWALFGSDGTIHVGAMEAQATRAAAQELAHALPLLAPDAEADLARRLGRAVLPPALRSALLAGSVRHLIVSPAASLGSMPFGWLALDDAGQRVVEHTTVLHGASLPVIARDHEPVEVGPSPPLYLVDPGGPLLFALPPALPPGQAACRAEHQDILRRQGHVTTSPATLGELRRLGGEGARRVACFIGHISGGSPSAPAAAGLVLQDASLTARSWLDDPASAPRAETWILFGCSSGGLGLPESSGLVTAALCAGASRVVSTAWDLANDAATTALIEDLMESIEDGRDPADAVAAIQRAALDRWRADARPSDAALSWGPLQVSGTAPSREGGRR